MIAVAVAVGAVLALPAGMAHPVGEHLRCDECGAEILYVKPCPCPAEENKQHADVCCDQPMRSLGIVTTTQAGETAARH